MAPPVTPSSASIISTIAGTGSYGDSGDGGPALQAKLWDPSCLAVAPDGSLYVGDLAASVVRKINLQTGIITAYAGTGVYGYSGNGTAAGSATLYGPSDCTVDASGNLFLADDGNNIIRRIDAVSGLITTVAGVQYEASIGHYSGDGGPATSAYLQKPDGIVVDSSGNLYIADTGNQRIRKVSAATGIITTIAGTGQNGWSGDGGLASLARLYNPEGMSMDAAGNLYVAEEANNDVRRIDAVTGVITTIAGVSGTDPGRPSGDGGPALSAVLGGPTKVKLDASGNIFITDWEAETVREIKAGSTTINRVVGSGQQGYSGDGGSPLNADLSCPDGLAFDSAGNMYIADYANGAVRKVTP